MPTQAYAGILKENYRTLPTYNVGMTPNSIVYQLADLAGTRSLGGAYGYLDTYAQEEYLIAANYRRDENLYGARNIPTNPRIACSPYALRQLHALRFLPNGTVLNPSDTWDTLTTSSDIEENTEDYPISTLDENSTKVKITVPPSPEVGEPSSFEFEWSTQNTFTESETNYKTLTTPTISSVELVEPPLHERIAFTALDKATNPDYLRISINAGYPENPENTVRFFNLIINGIDLGTYGAEGWASTTNSTSNLTLRTTDFSYGPLKIQVAVFHLIPDTTFVNMQYAKSDLSEVYEFNCQPNFGKKVYFDYGTYQMPTNAGFSTYYGNISDFSSENQTINTIPEEKDVKVIEVSNQTYKNSTLCATNKWGGGNGATSYYTPIFIDAELAVGKFKGTIKINKKKIYGGGDPYFFRGRLISQIEDIRIELLAPYKYPRQLNKTNTSYSADKPLYPGIIADIYNLTASKYYPSPFLYQSKYLYEFQPRMTRPDDGAVGFAQDLEPAGMNGRINTLVPTAIENILKRRYISNKGLIERNIVDNFKNDPGLLFTMDQRLGLQDEELSNISAALSDSLETKEFTFYGNIMASFKILTSVGKPYEDWFQANGYGSRTAKFKYSLTDLNTNKSIESGEEYTVLLFKPDTFGVSPLSEKEGISYF